MISFPVGEIGEAPASTELPPVAPPSFSRTAIIWAALFALWIAGVVISLFRLGSSLWRLHLTKAGAQRKSLTDIDCSSADLLHADTGTVSIALSERIKSPGVTGLFHPVILLPADILSWTSREDRTSILRHELAHLERRDHLASLFQSALNAFLFFHPMLRYACHQLNLEREIACDDRVLSLGTEPKAYAEAILKAVERSFSPDLIHVSFTSRRTLERRIDADRSKRIRQIAEAVVSLRRKINQAKSDLPREAYMIGVGAGIQTEATAIRLLSVESRSAR